MPGPLPRIAAAVLLFLAVAIPFSGSFAEDLPDPDPRFREGVALLENEDYPRARELFSSVPAESYDLGDYLLYFTGVSLAREGKRGEAALVLDRLSAAFPESPLLPYLFHELAFAAIRDDDRAAAAEALARSRGKVAGSARIAEERYVEARLLETEVRSPESPAPAPGDNPPGEEGLDGMVAAMAEGENAPPPPMTVRFLPTPEAARAHLENVTAYTVQEGAVLSMERLWSWRSGGSLSPLGLGGGFYGRFANALFRMGETERAGEAYREALELRPPPEEYYPILLDYAEFLRKQGAVARAGKLLEDALEEAPASFRAEVDFLSARVDWKAGRTAEARTRFLEIAGREVSAEIAERARYQAAWIYLEEGNLPAATEEFGRLVSAGDEATRRESIFRHAFGLYGQKRFEEAVAAFEAGRKRFDGTPVEQARHAFWEARALQELGREEQARALFASLAGDPSAGPFALFAAFRLGGEPFAIFSVPSAGETVRCEQEREELWERVRGAQWSAADAARVRRAERLARLGLPEYAGLEAEGVAPSEVRRVLGIAGAGTPGLFRYLAGDLRGAILETVGQADGRGPVGLAHRLQYPLAPQYMGNCDETKAGVDPLVLHAIIRQESLFQPNALSPAGAVGLMQLMPSTARRVAPAAGIRGRLTRHDLLRPERNIALGAAYLSMLLRRYGGDYLRAVAAYNAGESAVERWWERAEGDPALFLERVTYRETRGYLRKVFFNLLQYYRIYRPETFARYLSTVRKEAGPVPDASATPPAGATPGLPPGSGPAPGTPPGSPASAESGG
ncbi:MAG: hypothetical protein Kow00128_02820 [Deltaproteobacteria bacterium]